MVPFFARIARYMCFKTSVSQGDIEDERESGGQAGLSEGVRSAAAGGPSSDRAARTRNSSTTTTISSFSSWSAVTPPCRQHGHQRP